MTKQQTAGIHHITSFVQSAQGTVDFYAGILGLRLVKNDQLRRTGSVPSLLRR